MSSVMRCRLRAAASASGPTAITYIIKQSTMSSSGSISRHPSLIVVVSANDYGILYGSVGERDGWDTHVIESTKGRVEVRNLRGPKGNTYLHLPHPNYMRRRGVFDPAVSYVVQNARELRPFN